MAVTISKFNGLTYNDNTTARTGGNVTATGAWTIPAGTTAQRPGTPVTGMFRYNTTTGSLEVYNGSSWG
jgi:hypothetical protein